MPLVAKSTNLAGKASIIGGGLTKVAGWIILAGGTAFGLALLGDAARLERFPAAKKERTDRHGDRDDRKADRRTRERGGENG